VLLRSSIQASSVVRSIAIKTPPPAVVIRDGLLWNDVQELRAHETVPMTSSPEIQYPHWQPLFQAALLELEPERLLERIELAEAAISERLRAISMSTNHLEEQRAMGDALSSLRAIKRDHIQRG